jgi:hypothetical protein
MNALTLILATALLSWPACSQVVLYDIDFQTPDQPINGIVRTGSAPDHVSNILFGTPRVVPAFGSLTHQPLLFNSDGQTPTAYGYYYTQIQLDLADVQVRTLDLSFDFLDTGTGHFFTILFDTLVPFDTLSVRNFEFSYGGISFVTVYTSPVHVGNYPVGETCHFDVHIDYDLNQWSLSEDNTLLSQGAVNPVSYVRSIRFNYAAAGPNISGTAIDNIVVLIPEPRSLTSLACALCALVLWHRKVQNAQRE